MFDVGLDLVPEIVTGPLKQEPWPMTAYPSGRPATACVRAKRHSRVWNISGVLQVSNPPPPRWMGQIPRIPSNLTFTPFLLNAPQQELKNAHRFMSNTRNADDGTRRKQIPRMSITISLHICPPPPFGQAIRRVRTGANWTGSQTQFNTDTRRGARKMEGRV